MEADKHGTKPLAVVVRTPTGCDGYNRHERDEEIGHVHSRGAPQPVAGAGRRGQDDAGNETEMRSVGQQSEHERILVAFNLALETDVQQHPQNPDDSKLGEA